LVCSFVWPALLVQVTNVALLSFSNPHPTPTSSSHDLVMLGYWSGTMLTWEKSPFSPSHLTTTSFISSTLLHVSLRSSLKDFPNLYSPAAYVLVVAVHPQSGFLKHFPHLQPTGIGNDFVFVCGSPPRLAQVNDTSVLSTWNLQPFSFSQTLVISGLFPGTRAKLTELPSAPTQLSTICTSSVLLHDQCPPPPSWISPTPIVMVFEVQPQLSSSGAPCAFTDATRKAVTRQNLRFFILS